MKFLNKFLIVQEIRARIDKWDYIKLKSILFAYQRKNRVKRLPMEWKIIIARYSSNMEIISRIYNNSIIKYQNNKQPNQ
jgi:hypothetical protein